MSDSSPDAPSQGAPPSAAAQEQQVPPEAAEIRSLFCLRDGQEVLVRAIRADDSERLRTFHSRLSVDTVVFRFFRVVPELTREMADHFTQVDYVRRIALVATTGAGTEEEILGVVRYDALDAGTAEVAFVVRDEWQGHGIATALLHRLAAYARRHGFTTFVALTMGSNTRMLDVLRNSGFPLTMRYEGGDIEAHLDITAPPHPPYAAHSEAPAQRPS